MYHNYKWLSVTDREESMRNAVAKDQALSVLWLREGRGTLQSRTQIADPATRKHSSSRPAHLSKSRRIFLSKSSGVAFPRNKFALQILTTFFHKCTIYLFELPVPKTAMLNKQELSKNHSGLNSFSR